jgi:hypothetical protein
MPWFYCGFIFAAWIFMALPSFAQYSANIQGTVVDPAGAAVSGAHLRLTNANTGMETKAVSDAAGVYRFLSLAPGQYKLETQAAGFSKTGVTFTLVTNQTLDVPVMLTIAEANATVEVTGQPPVLDTAESRNQLTIESESVASLPLAGRNMVSLVTLAPGVTGLGAAASGSPGSGVDNYSTETQVDSSANGQGAVGNMYIIDGLDISSAIRAGVLNLTPNPDSIQEASIQVNTYSVEYGRASSIQMAMTTKSGGDRFHGSASDYFQNQALWAGTEWVHNYPKYHSNNMSASVGGPIWPHRQAFFFFAIEPMREGNASSGVAYFEDPKFVSWAESIYPNTIGTSILKNYPVTVTSSSVSQTAAQAGLACGTALTPSCSLPVIDSGPWASTSSRNGTQWNARLDKSFTNDRLYGDIYRTTLKTGSPAARHAFATTSQYWAVAWQGNETHTFSQNTINEAIVAGMRVEGLMPATGEFKVPVVNVTGLGTGFGDGFAMGDFIQHNYHWRDVLTHIKGAHTMKFGYEGWTGDDIEDFQGPHDMPTFQFNNIVDMVAADTSTTTAVQPYTETGVAYNPITGKHMEWDWNAASITGGVFFQDSWKMRRNLTVNYGIRWDDFGNPYSRSADTVFGNFYMGPGSTFTEKVANGYVLQKTHALNRAITDVASPRAGVSWDVLGNSQWVVHGGAGIFHNWPTPANEQEEMRGNPPGGIYPTFYGNDTDLTHRPIFGLGTTEAPPFGFTYPALTATTLNSHGGLNGLSFGIGGIDPNLKTPVAYIYSAQLEHPLTHSFVGSVGYSGSHAVKLLSGGGQVTSVSYGVDINAKPGDLLTNLNPTRYNTSFGAISYTMNDRRSNYNAFIADVRGRFARTGFIDLSYTHSVSKDNTQVYPDNTNPNRYYGPSDWDAPNRVSFTGNYEFRGLSNGKGLLGRATGGWGLSATVIGQSGTPFTVYTSASYAGGGDYNADGDNNDYPNVSSYNISHDRKTMIGKGVFYNSTAITAPTQGTAEGNENFNKFRNAGFFETDANLYKDTKIHDDLALQFRFEFFNLFNHPNLQGVDTNMADGANFGVVTSQNQPRWIQLGASLKF